MHPNHPYSSPRVTAHIADGRAFLQDTSQHYNLILFALPDSLTALAGQSGIRLESYLLTEQSLQAVRGPPGAGRHVRDVQLLRAVPVRTGTRPRSRTRSGGRPAPRSGRRSAAAGWPCSPSIPAGRCRTAPVTGTAARIAPATDDHPFPYLPSNTIPKQYLWMIAAIFAASLLLVRVGGGAVLAGCADYVDLAFMGAAFLLLETKNIVQFALLFGTTWLVNSLVFAGVLVAVYLAVETASHLRLPRPAVLYAALIASLALTWVVPQESLVGLPIVARFFAGSALAFAPIYLANLIFAQRFSDVATTGEAFAANLLGAMVGGVLEYVALITGYRFLLIVIGVLYGLAFVTSRFLTRRKSGRGQRGRRAGAPWACARLHPCVAVLVLVWLPARYPDGRPPDSALTRNDLMTSPGPEGPGLVCLSVRIEQPQEETRWSW